MSDESTVAPPGWPGAVPAPGHPEFPARAAAWLLDQGPAELRAHAVFRTFPVALARVVAHHVEGTLDATRRAYAGARRELRDVLPPEAVDAVLAALEREGARLNGLAREVALVEEALRGRRWRPKL